MELFLGPDELDEVAIGIAEDGDEVAAAQVCWRLAEELDLGFLKPGDGLVHVGYVECEVGNSDGRVDEFLVLHLARSFGEGHELEFGLGAFGIRIHDEDADGGWLVVGQSDTCGFFGWHAEARDFRHAEGFGVEFGGFFEILDHDANVGGRIGESSSRFFSGFLGKSGKETKTQEGGGEREGAY